MQKLIKIKSLHILQYAYKIQSQLKILWLIKSNAKKTF